jgi:lactoylglutathione lyase
MELGNFSISLTVKDMAASKDFYAALGFRPTGGDGQRVQILSNGAVTIGLFHGLFDRNILTFNPGWDANGNTLPTFTDVRQLQRQVRQRGIEPVVEADDSTAGPASFMLLDPDGNPILIDQHV